MFGLFRNPFGKSSVTYDKDTEEKFFNNSVKFKIPRGYTVTCKYDIRGNVKSSSDKKKKEEKVEFGFDHGNEKGFQQIKKKDDIVIRSYFGKNTSSGEYTVRAQKYNETMAKFDDDFFILKASGRKQPEQNFLKINNLPDFIELSEYVSKENIELLKQQSNFEITRKISVKEVKEKYNIENHLNNSAFKQCMTQLLSGLAAQVDVKIEENIIQNNDGCSYSITFKTDNNRSVEYKVTSKHMDSYIAEIIFSQDGVQQVSEKREYYNKNKDKLDIKDFYNNVNDIDDIFLTKDTEDLVLNKCVDSQRRIFSTDSTVFERQKVVDDNQSCKIMFDVPRHKYEGQYSSSRVRDDEKWFEDAKPKGEGKFTFASDSNLKILGQDVQFKAGTTVECSNWNGFKTITYDEDAKEEDRQAEITVEYNGEITPYTFKEEIDDETKQKRVKCYNNEGVEVNPNDICHADKNLEEAGAGLYSVGGYNTDKPSPYGGGTGGAGSTRTPLSSRNIEKSKKTADERTDEKNNKKDDKEKKTEDEDDKNKKAGLNNDNAKLSLDRNNIGKKPEFNVVLFVLLLLTIIGAILYWMDYKDKLKQYENNKRDGRPMMRF